MAAYFWDDPLILLYLMIAVLVLDNFWAVYLMLREIHVAYKVDKVPDVIQPFLPQVLYDRMRIYKIHKAWLTIVNALIAVVLLGVVELYFGFYAWLWGLAEKCALGKWMKHEACVSVIFVVMLSFYLWVKNLPAVVYEKMCIRKLQQRPQQPYLIRICQFLFELILGLIVTVIMVVALVFTFIGLGPFAPLALYLQMVVITVALILLIPIFIDPFMGRRVPLENGPLRTSLEGLTRRAGFPLRQVHIIRVHDPNAGSNAFFYGSCCLKRIVIFDTLLLNRGQRDVFNLEPDDVGKGLTDAQVTAVVAHELGHWKNGHFYKALITFQLHLALTITLFAFVFPHGPLYQAVGFEEGLQPSIVGILIIFGFVLTPYMTMINFAMLSMTRSFEYQADRYAFQMGYAADLRFALLKLYADNLAFPVSDHCYSQWHHTHPTMLERLDRLSSLQRGTCSVLMAFYDTWPKVDPLIILIVLCLIVVLDRVWEMIITKRQQLVCMNTVLVPEELRGIIPPEIYYRARIYELHKTELMIWKHFIDLIITLLELCLGFYPFIWGLAASTLKPVTAKEIWVSLVFVFYLTIYICLRFLPVLLYDKCLLELRYGLAGRFPWYLYIIVGILAIVLSQFILLPVTAMIVLGVKLIGYFFFLWFWLFWAVFTLLLVFFLPYCCIPCIGRQVVLPGGTPLYEEIKRVCDWVGFPMKRVFIIRTKSMQYSNAYFYGSCCLKRIVIFDTLLLNKGKDPSELAPYEIGRGLTNTQVAGVVCHELGHWKHGHFYKATIIMKLHFLITMVLFGLFFWCPQLYMAVGFKAGLCPIIVGFIIVLRFALTPYLTLANVLMLWNLRRFEYAADRFAHRMGYSIQLRMALVKIYADHMSFPVFDKCYAVWHHTHPTILQRLEYQQRLDMKAIRAMQRNAP